jgi:hypothetical protein
VGLILDLSVVALALLVIGSLALLAWTLAVSAGRSVRHGRRSVAASRRALAEAQDRVLASAAATSATLADLAARTTPPKPGDGPDV